MTKEVEKVLRARVLCSLSDPHFQDPIQDHTLHFVVLLIPLRLEEFLSLSLSVIALAFLKSAGQLFHRLSLNSGFSQLDSDHELWAKMLHVLCSQCLIRMHVVSVFSTTGDINNRHSTE